MLHLYSFTLIVPRAGRANIISLVVVWSEGLLTLLEDGKILMEALDSPIYGECHLELVKIVNGRSDVYTCVRLV